jgi:anti-sigma-K factor RskA
VTSFDPFAHYDGVYVLGALSAEERADFEDHLLTCAACTERVRGLAPLPALLAGLAAEVYDVAADDPPATLLPDLLRHVRSERRRRHWLSTSLAGVAAACLVALAVIAWPTGHATTHRVSTSAPQQMSAVISSPVHATAALTDVRWGTKIQLACRYDPGYVSDVDYQLVVIDKHNVAHPAGSWMLTPGKVTNFTGGTALHPDEIARVEIALPNQQPILQLTI